MILQSYWSKKLIFIAAFLVFVAATDASQAAGRSGWRVRVLSGPNSTALSLGQKYAGSISRGELGFSWGAGVDLGPLSAKLLYSREVVTILTSSGVTAARQSTAGLQVPLHLTTAVSAFRLGAGGFYELPLSNGGDSNYGLSAGIALGLPFPRFTLEALANIGLRNIDDTRVSTGALLLGYDLL